MSDTIDLEGIRRQLALTIHAHWKLFLAQGILMIVLGFLAVAEPNIATVAVAIFVGWLFFIGGIFRAASVWHSRHAPGFAWSMGSPCDRTGWSGLLPRRGVLLATDRSRPEPSLRRSQACGRQR